MLVDGREGLKEIHTFLPELFCRDLEVTGLDSSRVLEASLVDLQKAEREGDSSEYSRSQEQTRS